MPKAAPEYRPYHQPTKRRKPDLRHKHGKRLYNDAAWRVQSKQHIRENPVCVFCGGHLLDDQGDPIPGACVDHEPPHRGEVRMFWDKRCWRSSHAECHNRKTASVDRRRKSQCKSQN